MILGYLPRSLKSVNLQLALRFENQISAATRQSVHDAGHLACWLTFDALCCGDCTRRHSPQLQNRNLPASSVVHRTKQPPLTVCSAQVKDAAEFSLRVNICISRSAFCFLDLVV